MPGRGYYGGGRPKKGPAGLDREPKWPIDYKPPPTYPDVDSPRTRPPSQQEKRILSYYRAFRDRCRDGPLHSVLGHTVRVQKSGGRVATAVVKYNAFEGMKTYSTKYKRQERTLPKLNYRPYIPKFFPEELWSTLGPQYATGTNTPSSVASKKRLLDRAKKSDMTRLEASLERADNLTDDDDDEQSPSSERKTSKRPNGVKAADEAADALNKERDKDPDQNVGEEEEDQDALEAEVDSNFEDQEDGESAADDDYNAEKYFDNGEDDDFGDDAGDDFGHDGGDE